MAVTPAGPAARYDDLSAHIRTRRDRIQAAGTNSISAMEVPPRRNRAELLATGMRNGLHVVCEQPTAKAQ